MVEYGLDERYDRGFSNFLCHIANDIDDAVYDAITKGQGGAFRWGEQEDLQAVQKYVDWFDNVRLLLTIKHGLEILALEEFPHERIAETLDMFGKSQEEYYEWVKRLVRILEDEAVKSGKVTAEDVQLLHEGRLDVIIDPDQCRVVRK